MKNMLAALGVFSVFFAVPAFAADRCIGATVNGECIGTVMPDYGNAWRNQRPPDTWVTPDQGLRTSPAPDVGSEGNQFYNRTHPMTRGGELRWYDPREMERE